MVNPEDISGGFVPGGMPSKTGRPIDWSEMEKKYNPSPNPNGSEKETPKRRTSTKVSRQIQSKAKKTATSTKTKKQGTNMGKKTNTGTTRRDIRFVGGMGGYKPPGEEENNSTESQIPYGEVKWQDGPRYPDDSKDFKSLSQLPHLLQSKPTESGLLGRILARIQVLDCQLYPQYSGTQGTTFSLLKSDHDTMWAEEFEACRNAYRVRGSIYAGFDNVINADKVYIQQSDTIKLLWEMSVLDNRNSYYHAKDKGMTNTFFNRLSEVLSQSIAIDLRNRMGIALRGNVIKKADHDRIFSMSQTYLANYHEAGGTNIIVSPRMMELMENIGSATTTLEVSAAFTTYKNAMDHLIELVQFQRVVLTSAAITNNPEMELIRVCGSQDYPIYDITGSGDPNTAITKSNRSDINDFLLKATEQDPSLGYIKIKDIPRGNSEAKYSEKFADKFNNMQARSGTYAPSNLGVVGNASSTPITKPESPDGDVNLIYCSERSESEQDF